MAQLVERHLAKVEVAGSTPVARSCKSACRGSFPGCEGRTSEPLSLFVPSVSPVDPPRDAFAQRFVLDFLFVSYWVPLIRPADNGGLIRGDHQHVAVRPTAKVGGADLPVPGHCDIFREDCLGVVPRAAQIPDDSPGKGV